MFPKCSLVFFQNKCAVVTTFALALLSLFDPIATLSAQVESATPPSALDSLATDSTLPEAAGFDDDGDDEDGPTRRDGYIVGGTLGLGLPIADFGDRFGWYGQAGGALYHKSAENWLIGLEANVLYGSQVNEPVGQNLVNSAGFISSSIGEPALIDPQLRGFTVSARAGKIIEVSKKNRNSGLLLMGGVGFLQHRVRFEGAGSNAPQLDGAYLKGYDRLTNGVLLQQTIAFFFLNNNRLGSFQFGIDFGQGLTHNRRTFNFDTMLPENDLRLDFSIGLRLGILIPVYVSDKDEYYYY